MSSNLALNSLSTQDVPWMGEGRVVRSSSPRVEQLANFIRPSGPSDSRTRFCAAAGCILTTREGKPYCPDHVDRHPYVQNLLSALAEREDEESKVKQRGARAVNPEGLAVKELILHLSLHGARTEERLCRELQMEPKVLDGYINSLKRRGIIAFGRTNRGSTVIRLAKVVSDDGTVMVDETDDLEVPDETSPITTSTQESAA